MSTEDDVVPGNNGLKDQIAALKWINNNIKYFGGNHKSLTIAGNSAGGASVHLHYLIPESRGLLRLIKLLLQMVLKPMYLFQDYLVGVFHKVGQL